MSRRHSTARPDDVEALIRRTCIDRGLPERIDDPATIARLAAIVAAGGEAA